MEGGWLARLRWRRRGAWLWPTFVAATFIDGVIVHALPLAGSTQSMAGGVVAGLVLNVLAVLLLSRPLGGLLRRRRRDLPTGVARNYGGTSGVWLVSVLMLAFGLLHHPSIVAERQSLRDATIRAMAFIGDRAPSEFRANLSHPDTYTIQGGSVYRTCVPNRDDSRTYCVIVRPRLPFASSVAFAGYEPNSSFSQGVN